MLSQDMCCALFVASWKASDRRLVFNVAEAQRSGVACGPRCAHNGLLLAPPAWSDIVTFYFGQNAGIACFSRAHDSAVRADLPVCSILGMSSLVPEEQVSTGLVKSTGGRQALGR
jgi:hypothetical protein